MQNFRCYLVLGFVLGALLTIASTHCDDRLRVVVIDTGIDFRGHPELAAVACPDKEHFNAVTNKPGQPIDEHGHGTHVAGIIRALAGDKGYCLAACKFYSDANPGSINLRNSTRCLKFAEEIGAAVVNMSEGGPEFSEDEYLALKRLPDAHIFACAGNEHQSIDVPTQEYYPASYRLSNKTVVGAVDFNGKRTPSSNFGNRVDIQLPGENLYSTLPGGRFGYMSGTSQATAVATGLFLRTRAGLPSVGKHQEYWKFLTGFWKR